MRGTGAHLENLVLSDLLAWSGSRVDGPSIMHWRTASGAEVDFVGCSIVLADLYFDPLAT